VISQLGSIRPRVPVIACAALAVCQLGLFAPQARASLDLDLATVPDIYVNSVSVSYDASTDSFVAEGIPISLEVTPGYAELFSDSPPGTFLLTATIDESGSLSSGSLTITGQVPSRGFDGTILTGDVRAFEPVAAPMSSSPDVFTFMFDVTGGEAAPLYNAAGFAGGFQLAVKSGFAGAFDVDFTGVDGCLDVRAVVPEPGSLVLWSLLGGCAVGAACWRRRRRRAG